MTSRPVTHCGLCGSVRLRVVLSLGSSPPTCVMTPTGRLRVAETHHPLEMLVCDDCTLAQLSVIVDPEIVFPPAYPYSSGNSRALHENFEDLARQASGWLGELSPEDLVVDVGSNDGTLLSKFDCLTVGVEPTWQGRKGDADAVWQTFFSEHVAREIVAEYGHAKVITACNVLAHVEDIGDVMRGIDLLLADDGVLVAENHDLASVVDGGQWDTVYHEHLRFYSPHSFSNLLEAYGLKVGAWSEIPTHGGSFRTIAQRRPTEAIVPPARSYDFDRLARAAIETRAAIRETATGGVYGIGATARATTIINYCGLDIEDIACICEVAGSDKIGHYIPGTRIPVIDEDWLFDDQPEQAILFSWHLADRIVPKLRERGYTGEIIVPLPTLQAA